MTTAASSLPAAVEVSPMWDHDELQYRKDLELAANGFKESTITSFLDVNFFDFLALATAEQTPKVEEPFLLQDAVCEWKRASSMSASLSAKSADELQNLAWEEQSQNSTDAYAASSKMGGSVVGSVSFYQQQSEDVHTYDNLDSTTTPLQQRTVKKSTTSSQRKKKSAATTISMKFSQDDVPKMRSPQSRTMEPISPIVTAQHAKSTATRKRKRKDSGMNSQSVGTPIASMSGAGDSLSSQGAPSPLNRKSTPAKKKRRTESVATPTKEGAATPGISEPLGTVQKICCVLTCEGVVTNRLRTSLRGTSDADFKKEYLERGWARVCSRCYFRNFYANRVKKS